jgi:hypothetical protein
LRVQEGSAENEATDGESAHAFLIRA